jgi:hypothetical protein
VRFVPTFRFNTSAWSALKFWAWTEADCASTDLETLLTDMLANQHRNSFRVIAFNVAGGWSRDVSEDVAIELRGHHARSASRLRP